MAYIPAEELDEATLAELDMVTAGIEVPEIPEEDLFISEPVFFAHLLEVA